jgi:hypothetical protein
MSAIGQWVHWTPERTKEVNDALASDHSLVMISELLGIDRQVLYRYNRLAKIRNVVPHASGSLVKYTKVPALPTKVSEIDAQLAELAKQKAFLERRRIELSIVFELDGDNVIVHGIADQSVALNKKATLAWLINSGAAKLREFIEKHP